MRYTVLGGRGFIGSHLKKHLIAKGFDVYVPDRNDPEWLEQLLNIDLGIVFYCIGLTANFREYPLETVDGHVCVLNKLFKHANMEQLIYLSSTRVYEGAKNTEEYSALNIQPNLLSHLYNLSKLMGESICLNSSRKAKVVRLSNVYGLEMKSENFLSSILREAVMTNSVKFRTSSNSSKDFISIDDVAPLILQIATSGKDPVYNLASGKNTTNLEIAKVLRMLRIEVEFEKNASQWCMPEINITKLQTDIGRPRNNLIADLPKLIDLYRIK